MSDEPPVDVLDLAAELLAVAMEPAARDREQLHSDFVHVFLSSEQGRRVLRTILNWGHILGSPLHEFDSNKLWMAEGERNLAYRILAAAMVEPKPHPPQTSKHRPRRN